LADAAADAPTPNCGWGIQFPLAIAPQLEYVRELLGHKHLKMIRKHYGHLFDEIATLHGVLADMKTL